MRVVGAIRAFRALGDISIIGAVGAVRAVGAIGAVRALGDISVIGPVRGIGAIRALGMSAYLALWNSGTNWGHRSSQSTWGYQCNWGC
jgi:hypothetical protein